METGDKRPADGIRAELVRARAEFHGLLDSLTDADLHRKSKNPGWTNGELLFHMTFAYMILSALVPMVRLWGKLPGRYSLIFARTLDFFTPAFNLANATGARIGGRIYSRERIRRKYDSVYGSVVRSLECIDDREWQRGMYYPARWDALFGDYMTLEDVFRYPIAHFEFHRDQVAHERT